MSKSTSSRPSSGGRRRHPDQLQRHPRPVCARAGTGSQRVQVLPRGARYGTGAPARPGTGSTLATKASSDMARRTHVSPRRPAWHPCGAVRSRKPDAITLASAARGASLAEVPQRYVRRRQTVEGSYVIGADGIHSRVRTRLFGPTKPEFTGCIAWRGLIPMGELPPQLVRRFGHELARAARPRAALSGAARRDHELS